MSLLVREIAPVVFALYDKYINMGAIKTFDQAFDMFIINVEMGEARYPTDEKFDYKSLNEEYQSLTHEEKENFNKRFMSIMSGNSWRMLYRHYKIKDMESFNLTLAGIVNGSIV